MVSLCWRGKAFAGGTPAAPSNGWALKSLYDHSIPEQGSRAVANAVGWTQPTQPNLDHSGTPGIYLYFISLSLKYCEVLQHCVCLITTVARQSIEDSACNNMERCNTVPISRSWLRPSIHRSATPRREDDPSGTYHRRSDTLVNRLCPALTTSNVWEISSASNGISIHAQHCGARLWDGAPQIWNTY